MGQQIIKCKVSDCLHWARDNNCDLQEIWVERKAGMAAGMMSALTGSAGTQEQDTFCASFDAKR